VLTGIRAAHLGCLAVSRRESKYFRSRGIGSPSPRAAYFSMDQVSFNNNCVSQNAGVTELKKLLSAEGQIVCSEQRSAT